MEKLDLRDTSVNVGELERTQSLITGTLFLLSGINSISRHPVASSLKTLIGGYLIYRSVTGHCHLNQMMQRNTANS